MRSAITLLVCMLIRYDVVPHLADDPLGRGFFTLAFAACMLLALAEDIRAVRR